MKTFPIIPVVSLALATLSPAADPPWWTTRGVKNASPGSNLSPATIGQAKHMAAMALKEIENRVPAQDFAALEAEVEATADLEPPSQNPPSPPPGYIGPNNQILLVGQLKALAKPFYDILRSHNPSWLNAEMGMAGIKVQEPGTSPPVFSPYPWSEATTDDKNMAPCVVGQLKAVFSIDLSLLAPALQADRDGDGAPDDSDAFPDDPTRHLAPLADPMDTTEPTIWLTVPEGATEL